MPTERNRIDDRAERPRIGRYQLKRTRCDWHAQAQAELRDGVMSRLKPGAPVDNDAVHRYEEIVTALASWIAHLARQARGDDDAARQATRLLAVLAAQGRTGMTDERLTTDAIIDLGAGVTAAIRAFHSAADPAG